MQMDAVCKGNRFAKSAVEMAAIDAVALAQRARLPTAGWQAAQQPATRVDAGGAGDSAKDIEEAERMLEIRRHRIFKLKIGARAPADDVAHVSRIARALDGRASMTVDINQAWDGNTARRYVPDLIDAGVTLFEQPVAQWNEEARWPHSPPRCPTPRW